MGELLEEMALTGKLKLCIGEGSAKNLQQCKRIDTTTNVNEKEKLNGPQLVGSNSRKLLKSTRVKQGSVNLAFYPDP